MDEIVQQLDALKARWMTGGAVSGAGPAAWQDLDALSQLALAGQFQRVAMRPADPGTATPRPDLPELDQPPLPEALRPQLRRVLDTKEVPVVQVIRLITTRGYGVNPIDWMPKPGDADLPALYEPWRDWLAGHVTVAAELNAETWEDFAPGRRYQELTRLHRDSPEAARTLVVAIAPTLAAEQRLRLLQCLRPSLSAADAELLSGFLTDRSSKVQALVKTQLARLGAGLDADGEAVAQIADFVELAKAGILSRRRVVTARALKTTAQRTRRSKVFADVPLTALAGVLGLGPDEVIEAWDFGEADEDFCVLVAASGTDAQVQRLIDRAYEAGLFLPRPLLERLDDATRLRLALRVLETDDVFLTQTREWITAPDGTVGWEAVSRMKALPQLVQQAVEAEHRHQEAFVAQALAFLGLLVDRDAATRLIETLTTAGVMAVDPRLTLLRLNAAL